MARLVLITGGAGFIGSHLADELLQRGDRVRVIDNLDPQVHGPDAGRPEHLDPEVELIHGDVRDPILVRRALRGVDAVVHLAASVGVGQSMYRLADYLSVNDLGTAILLEALLQRPVERMVVASSMSIYGEGLYRTVTGELVEDVERDVESLCRGDWEVRDASGEALVPVPTPETKRPALASTYALSKFDQERLCLMVGRAYGMETVALRFFNVYGPRQALSNPYTGVLAIFASRLLNGRPPMIYEDGLQQRDFVNVRDVARACALALDSPGAAGGVFNVGSGRAYAVRDVAESLARVLAREDIRPCIVGKYRAGDIRHCFADISRARATLGYEPRVTWEEGLAELAEWLAGRIPHDRVEEASAELAARGLTV